MISMVKTDLQEYDRQLVDATGCSGYLFTPTTLAIDTELFQRLNRAVPALLELLDTPDYFDHCLTRQHWHLPVKPMKPTDFTGCADFLLTDTGAKLIEMNINLPGKVGLMQTLGETARTFLGKPEADWMNLQFNERLFQTIREAIPANVSIALLVSHLPASRKHQPHYRFFSEQLNRAGFDTTVVQANELTVTPTGCTANGKEFAAFISLVIPFVWEGNPDEFEPLTQLWQQHSPVFFPNPTGGMFGTKDLLNYLNNQRSEPNASDWTEFVLGARMLDEFPSPTALLRAYQPAQMVLKPLKDYDTKGVFVQPDRTTVEQVFAEKKDEYMVQEFTSSLEIPFQLPSGETARSHSVIFRIFFAEKQPIGYQGYFIHGAFNGDYYTAPVSVGA